MGMKGVDRGIWGQGQHPHPGTFEGTPRGPEGSSCSRFPGPPWVGWGCRGDPKLLGITDWELKLVNFSPSPRASAHWPKGTPPLG